MLLSMSSPCVCVCNQHGGTIPVNGITNTRSKLRPEELGTRHLDEHTSRLKKEKHLSRKTGHPTCNKVKGGSIRKGNKSAAPHWSNVFPPSSFDSSQKPKKRRGSFNYSWYSERLQTPLNNKRASRSLIHIEMRVERSQEKNFSRERRRRRKRASYFRCLFYNVWVCVVIDE
jgi:hypothetical protein